MQEAEEVQSTQQAEGEDVKQTFILQTAGFDARFPNTNQTKHCWQSYVDYFKCIKLYGDDCDSCRHFYRTYHSLCPNRWIARWDEQREAGKFPARLVDHHYCPFNYPDSTCHCEKLKPHRTIPPEKSTPLRPLKIHECKI